jgi:type IV secretory pathway ATPase VirB11/archaellum biosynthesis ATPase
LSPALSLEDLVGTGTVSEEGAETLREIGRSGQSFIVYSLPRGAGKSTLVEAILAHRRLPRYDFLGTQEEVRTLSAGPERGYLVVAEMGHRGRPGYLAGEEVERAFRLAREGFSLATSLHADDLDGALDVLARHGITASAAAAVHYFVKVQPLGDPGDASTRRVVETIDEVKPDGDGLVVKSLYRDGSGQGG